MNSRCRTMSSIKVILILTSFFLLNCGGQSEVQEAVVERQDSFQSYQLDLKGESIPFADLIDKIEITRLEETQESLLGFVRQVEFYEDKMVIPSGNEGSIYVFSKTGKFLNKINRKGEGPEEYTSYNDVWLEGDTLVLYNYRRSINRYDLAGSFISRDKMLEHAAHVHVYESGYALDMNYRLTQDSLQYALVTLDQEMKLTKVFLPFSKIPDFWVSFSEKTVFLSENDLFYFPMMTNTVYKIHSDTVRPYIHYDFQDDWYFQPGVEVSDAVFTEAETKGQVWFMSNKIGRNYIYLTANLGMSQNKVFLIDRNTNENIRIDFENQSEEDYQMASVHWQGDELLVSLQSTQLSELLDQLDQDQYSFTEGTTLEEIESSENPVLVWVKFKSIDQ